MREARDGASIPGSGLSPGGGQGNLLQYSCLENPMDKGVWQATVHGVAHDWSDLARMHTRSKCGCFREELEWSESGKYECSPWEAYRGSRILRGERERHCFHWDFPLGKTLFTWGIWGLKETMLTQYSAQKCQGFFFSFSFCYQTLRTVPELDFPILEESSVQLDSISSGTNGSFRLQSPGGAAHWSGMTSKQNQEPAWCDLLGPVLVSLVPVA